MDSQLTRRRLLRTTAAGIGTSLLVSRGALPVAANSGGWPQFGYDAGNTGYNPEANGPTSEPEEVWGYDADQRPKYPVVANGGIYFSIGDTLICLDSEDGTELWTHTEETEITIPAVRDGRVYAATADGNVLSLDTGSGGLQWRSALVGTDASAPTVSGEHLYLSDDEGLYQLQRSDGQIQWGVDVREERRRVTAVTEQGVWLSGSSLVQLATVELLREYQRTPSDEELWEELPVLDFAGSEGNPEITRNLLGLRLTEERFEAQGAPSAVEGTVYLPSLGVQAIDALNGEIEWTFEENVLVTQPPTVVEDTLYVASGDGFELANLAGDAAENAGTVYALDRSNGTVNWRTDLGEPIDTQMAATPSSLYITTGGGTIVGLDRETGDELWTMNVDGGTGAPVVAHDRLYVWTTENGLLALEEPEPDPTPTPTPTPTPGRTPTPMPDETPEDDDTGGSSDDGSGPGFGLFSGLAGLGGAAYFLRRSRDDEDE